MSNLPKVNMAEIERQTVILGILNCGLDTIVTKYPDVEVFFKQLFGSAYMVMLRSKKYLSPRQMDSVVHDIVGEYPHTEFTESCNEHSDTRIIIFDFENVPFI